MSNNQSWDDNHGIWDQSNSIWDLPQLLREILENGVGSQYDGWAQKNPKKKKRTIKLITKYNNLTESQRKDLNKIKITVSNVQLTVEDAVRRVENIIFIGNNSA
jgi:hypothetical protein